MQCELRHGGFDGGKISISILNQFKSKINNMKETFGM
jgi:hypothetical protein